MNIRYVPLMLPIHTSKTLIWNCISCVCFKAQWLWNES